MAVILITASLQILSSLLSNLIFLPRGLTFSLSKGFNHSSPPVAFSSVDYNEESFASLSIEEYPLFIEEPQLQELLLEELFAKTYNQIF